MDGRSTRPRSDRAGGGRGRPRRGGRRPGRTAMTICAVLCGMGYLIGSAAAARAYPALIAFVALGLMGGAVGLVARFLRD